MKELKILNVNILLIILPAENVAFHPLPLCKASVTNLINISPLEAVNVILGGDPEVKPDPGCKRSPLTLDPS